MADKNEACIDNQEEFSDSFELFSQEMMADQSNSRSSTPTFQSDHSSCEQQSSQPESETPSSQVTNNSQPASQQNYDADVSCSGETTLPSQELPLSQPYAPAEWFDITKSTRKRKSSLAKWSHKKRRKPASQSTIPEEFEVQPAQHNTINTEPVPLYCFKHTATCINQATQTNAGKTHQKYCSSTPKRTSYRLTSKKIKNLSPIKRQTPKEVHLTVQTQMCEGDSSLQINIIRSPRKAPAKKLFNDVRRYQRKPKKKNAYTRLTNPNTIKNLIQILHKEKLLDNFVLLVEEISKKRLPPTNMAVLAALERAKLCSLKNSVGMVYDSRWKQFCQVLYRIVKGKGIRFMSGGCHKGTVMQGSSERGHYDPLQGRFNFAIPSIQVLSQGIKDMPSHIPPGIISHTLDIVDKEKQHHIAVDGKRIAQGLCGQQLGDINLWDLEGPPSLEEKQHQLNNLKQKIEEIGSEIDDKLKPEVVTKFRTLLTDFTQLLRSTRINRVENQKKLTSLLKKAENNPDKNYQLAVSSVKTHLLRSQNFITRCLLANKSICCILSNIQLTPFSFANSDHIDMAKQINYKILHDVPTCQKFYNLNQHTYYIKQYTDMWKEVRAEARITGSSAFNAIGLRQKKEADEHYRHYVNKFPQQKKTPEVEKKMAYGTQNEINGVATFAGIIMPALFPPCAMMYEEGASFIHSPLRHNLMEVSPDGFIAVCHTEDSCYKPSALFHSSTIFELKCPYPDEQKLPVHYDIPHYYAIQLLAEMKAKNTTCAIYGTYGKESCTFIELRFDATVWNNIWMIIEEMYGPSIPDKLKGVPLYKEHLNMELKTYIQLNSTLIAEVPSCKGMQSPIDHSTAIGPHYTPDAPAFTLTSIQSIVDNIKVLCTNSIPMVEDGYQILRQKATEILAFIITDIDRQFSHKIPPHMPLAYALKGPSLSVATMREMMQRVRLRCQENATRILSESYDGQWAMMIMKSQTGEPLSRIQLSKRLWGIEKKKRKQYMIEFLEDRSWNSEVIWKKSTTVSITSDFGLDKICTSTSAQIWETPQMKAKKEKALQNLQHNTTTAQHCLSETDTYVLQVTFRSIPVNSPLSIYSNILQRLRKIAPNRWVTATPESLKRFTLEKTTSITKLHVTELNSICNAVKEVSNKIMFKLNKLKKPEKVRVINKLFGDGIHTEEEETIPQKKRFEHTVSSTQQKREVWHSSKAVQTEKTIYIGYVNQHITHDVTEGTHSIQGGVQLISRFVQTASTKAATLRSQARKTIASPLYPKEALAAAICGIKHEAVNKEWESKCTFPWTSIPLPFFGKQHSIYWYPEYDEYLQDILLRSLDPSHLLTNLRTALTQKGALGVYPSDYKIVCDAKILRSIVIEDNLDQQNVEAAIECFSKKVEKCLQDNNRPRAARVIATIRKWYAACDERCVPAARRAMRLQDMSELLLENVDFSKYPPPGNNVHGVPIITYEGILQCNTMRLALYAYADEGTYNHRAISTLAAESFFSDLSALEYTTTGCPKAVQIPTLIGHVTQMNKHKHDPSKYFFMELSNRSVYPTHAMDLVEGEERNIEVQHDKGYFKNHQFDIQSNNSNRRKAGKAFKVNHPDETAKGTRGVRQHYKLDHSKIQDLKKL